jgi:broad specificity phosphatase PhoE
MTVFYLIRHGEKEEMIGDAALSLVGRMQARATARHLQHRPINSVYTSPLRWAQETAVHIAFVHGLSLVEDARLRERANWGDLPGQSFMDFVAMWERSTHDPEYIPPAGDSARKAGERMEMFLLETAHKHPHDEIVAVAHGGIITDFLVHIIPLEQLEQWYPKFLALRSRLIPECSITMVRYNGAQFILEQLATVEHLACLEEQR